MAGLLQVIVKKDEEGTKEEREKEREGGRGKKIVVVVLGRAVMSLPIHTLQTHYHTMIVPLNPLYILNRSLGFFLLAGAASL